MQVQIDDSPEVKYNQVSLYTLLMRLHAKGFRSQTIILPMLEHFLHISLLSLHNNDMKFLMPWCYGGLRTSCIFLSSSKLECGIQEFYFYSREIRAHLHFWHFKQFSNTSYSLGKKNRKFVLSVSGHIFTVNATRQQC